MTELLAVTLGNSNAAMALVRGTDGGHDLTHVRRVPVARVEDLRAGLVDLRTRHGPRALPVAVASVNPGALTHLRNLCRDLGHSPPKVAGEDFPIPLATDVDEPKHVGADRLLAALAAYDRAGGACVVVDFGTAITVNAIRRDGVFLGGAILPGLTMMARALAERTALLPDVPLTDHAPPIGRNTEEAIITGILRGTAGAVSHLVAAARSVVGDAAPVFVAGGHAPWITPHLPPDCRSIFPNLVLNGLVLAYGRWHSR